MNIHLKVLNFEAYLLVVTKNSTVEGIILPFREIMLNMALLCLVYLTFAYQ